MQQVNWGLALQENNPGNAFLHAYEAGRAKRRERDMREALSGYATSSMGGPMDEGKTQEANEFLRVILKNNPQLGMQLLGQQRERAERVKLVDLRRRAASGDQTALQELAGLDPETYGRFTKPENQPASIDEYNFAKGQGFGGSYMDFLETKRGPIVANNGDGTFTIIPRQQFSGGQSAPQGGGARVPEAAIAHLKSNPDLAAAFDEKYGPGTAEEVLSSGGQTATPSGSFP